MVPGSIETITIGGSIPIFIINGQTYVNGDEDYKKYSTLLDQLKSLRVNEIKRIMVIPSGNLAYYYASHNNRHASIVVIETYSKGFRGDPDGIKTFILDGLDTPRVFYSPRYEGAAKESKLYDGRATLYWNPAIRTDLNGEATVEFFTGDRKTEMDVILNGIGIGTGNTGDGRTVIKMKD
jgi:hypothetical protein